jgi:cyclopropane fatty-acyl-phospholipid synthase-like methyltransferase
VSGKPIFSESFWAERLRNAKERHHAVYVCPRSRWGAIEAKHREILARHIRPDDSVIEAGCAWGRLLDLMPPDWRGPYLGVDLSPDFVEAARRERPGRTFVIADLRDLSQFEDGLYDWAVMISMRAMVIREAGAAEWGKIEAELRRVARRILILEYSADEEGEVIGDELPQRP